MSSSRFCSGVSRAGPHCLELSRHHKDIHLEKHSQKRVHGNPHDIQYGACNSLKENMLLLPIPISIENDIVQAHYRIEECCLERRQVLLNCNDNRNRMASTKCSLVGLLRKSWSLLPMKEAKYRRRSAGAVGKKRCFGLNCTKPLV